MSAPRQRNYRNLGAWRRAHALTIRLYELTRDFPDEERYGLVSQVRRSAFGIGANIAEGSGRETDRDFLRFLYIALGSLKETEYAMLLASDLDYLTVETHETLTDEINPTFAALQGLIAKVRQDSDSPETT